MNDEIELSNLPKRVDRLTAAHLITQFYFPISHRTLERWPIGWRIVNGRAIADVAELFAEAECRLHASPPIIGGARA